MTRTKLDKFTELSELENVLEKADGLEAAKRKLDNYVAGAKAIFELGCGKGDYVLALAEKHPDKKFVGVDIKGQRIWSGARKALDKGLENVLFLRIQIENILEYVRDHTIDEIWITFADPFPKGRHEKKRLTNPRFIESYKQLLKPGGIIHLKTDAESLYEYTKEVIEENKLELLKDVQDVHNTEHGEEDLEILTYYETNHIREGKKIYYLRFRP